MPIQNLCLYCGSSPGRLPVYADAARSLARAIAQRGIGIVYGGARVGLMGEVANAALEAGGKVVGVIPQALVDKEVAHAGLTELRIVASMHERKATMADLADGFIALPGGVGTLEEIFESWTWAQLGIHDKPCALFDVAGYYTDLIRFLDRTSAEGFVRDAHRAMLIQSDDPDTLLDALAKYEAPVVPKWVQKSET